MKDFATWNKLKRKIEEETKQVFFHERQIWYCHFGLNIGHELDGKNDDFVRPVIIFRKFGMNTFLAIPLSSKNKRHYFKVSFRNYVSYVVLNQIRTMDSRRLIKSIKYISRSLHNRLKKELSNALNIKVPKYETQTREPGDMVLKPSPNTSL